MFTIDFNPVIFKAGLVEIRWYGIIALLGFAFFFLWLRYVGKKKWIDGLDTETAEDLTLYSIIGVVLGARIFYFLFYEQASFLTDPLEFFKVWHGGLSFHGGLLGFFIAVVVYAKKKNIDFWKLLDCATVVAIFSLMLGRIGNLLNGELPGTPFDGSWCAIFANYDSVCRHPYPIYAAISHFILFAYLAIVIYVYRHRAKELFGTKILSIDFMLGYGILRIIVDIWKIDMVVYGVKTGQWLSILMVLIALYLTVVNYKKIKEFLIK